MACYAVTMIHGPDWNPATGIRQQKAWDEHAVFMDGLVDRGFVLLGGPVGDGQRVLLAIEAVNEQQVRARLDEDPWARMKLLTIGEIQPWTIWLDGKNRK
jgi:hypothetical protein